MHSYILVTTAPQTTNLATIADLLNLPGTLEIINNPDVFYIGGDNASIKIEQIRELKSLNLRMPVHLPYSITIIDQAELMTTQSQHAVLKLLEEPAPQSRIVLITANTDALLPTIRSRCQVIKSPTIQPSAATQNNIIEIAAAPLTKRLTLIEPYTKDRDTAQQWLTQAISVCQNQISNTPHVSAYLKNLQIAHQDLVANVNVKLAMDQLVLNLEKNL